MRTASWRLDRVARLEGQRTLRGATRSSTRQSCAVPDVDEPNQSSPDFWLIECDTFWHDLGVDRVACWIADGPRPMIDGYEVSQWLVRVEPSVADRGITTDRVLVDVHEPDRLHDAGWTLYCTGVYSLHPTEIGRRIGGHKMTATTDPDLAYQ